MGGREKHGWEMEQRMLRAPHGQGRERGEAAREAGEGHDSTPGPRGSRKDAEMRARSGLDLDGPGGTPLHPPGQHVRFRPRGHCPQFLPSALSGGLGPPPGQGPPPSSSITPASGAPCAEGRSEGMNGQRRERAPDQPLCARRARRRAQPKLSPPPLGQASPPVSSPRGPQRTGQAGPVRLHAHRLAHGGALLPGLLGRSVLSSE